MTTDPAVAAAAEAKGGRFVEAFGNRYELADEIATIAVLEFGKAASEDVDSDSLEGAVVMYDFLEAVFTDESWPRFRKDSKKARAGNAATFAVVKEALAIINGFPTSQPSTSSDGPESITPSSTVSSFEEHKRALGMVPITPEVLAELAG